MAQSQLTFDTLARAGADLQTRHPEKQQELAALLAQFGIQQVSQLNPAQYEAFAMGLRNLGANI